MRPHCICLVVLFQALVVFAQGWQSIEFGQVPTYLQQNKPFEMKWKAKFHGELQEKIWLRLIDSTINQEVKHAITPESFDKGKKDGTVTITIGHVGTFLIKWCNDGSRDGPSCGIRDGINVLGDTVPPPTATDTSSETEQHSPDPTQNSASKDPTGGPAESSTSTSSSQSAPNPDSPGISSSLPTSDNITATQGGPTTSTTAASSPSRSESSNIQAIATPNASSSLPATAGISPSNVPTSVPSSASGRSVPGAIAGGVIGGLALIGIIAFLLIRRHKSQRRRSENIFNRELMVRPRTSSLDDHTTYGAAAEEKRMLARSEE